MVEITVGQEYRLGSYKSPDRTLVTVTGLNPEWGGWYDDHQGGGWWTYGCVEFAIDGEEGFCESLEYAQDNWETITTKSPCT